MGHLCAHAQDRAEERHRRQSGSTQVAKAPRTHVRGRGRLLRHCRRLAVLQNHVLPDGLAARTGGDDHHALRTLINTDISSGISPAKRLLIETGVALLLIYGSKCCILHFQGLWGIERLALGWAIPLTVLTIVGIINAINLIDGIDGLLSGFGILICGFYGLLCFLAHDYSNAALAAVTIGSLATFFLHNVFGDRSKMFLGDGGSMLLGILISWLIISILGGHFHLDEYWPEIDFNLISFALAIVAIPVADTLRVMFTRILRKRSPFLPDNSHLHHHFLRCGFSHLETTLTMLGMALVIIGAFLLAWALGASADWQLYTVIAVTALLDGGGAWLLGRLEKARQSGEKKARAQSRQSSIWKTIQRLVDL